MQPPVLYISSWGETIKGCSCLRAAFFRSSAPGSDETSIKHRGFHRQMPSLSGLPADVFLRHKPESLTGRKNEKRENVTQRSAAAPQLRFPREADEHRGLRSKLVQAPLSCFCFYVQVKGHKVKHTIRGPASFSHLRDKQTKRWILKQFTADEVRWPWSP